MSRKLGKIQMEGGYSCQGAVVQSPSSPPTLLVFSGDREVQLWSDRSKRSDRLNWQRSTSLRCWCFHQQQGKKIHNGATARSPQAALSKMKSLPIQGGFFSVLRCSRHALLCEKMPSRPDGAGQTLTGGVILLRDGSKPDGKPSKSTGTAQRLTGQRYSEQMS